MFIRKYWIGLTVFLLAIVGISLYYLQTPPPKGPIVIYKPVEYEKQRAKAPVVEQPAEVGHFHPDGTFHAEPHEPITTPSEVSDPEVSRETTAPQMEYNRGAGNPPPFDKVPVDLWDFEATKAAMTENLNFFMANWHPFEYNREVSIASATIENIDNAARATDLGLFTPEQASEIHAIYDRFFDFQGFERGHIPRLMDEGYTRKEAGRIASEELLERQKQQWGVK